MSGLRLIVGFEVRDEDFFTRIEGTDGCPVREHGGGRGPFCNECGAKFVEHDARVMATRGALSFAHQFKRDAADPKEWRVWVQDASRSRGAVVVGRSGQSTVMGLIVGHYEAGKRMAWPDHVVAELAIKCDVMKDELMIGAAERENRPICVMLIE